MTPVAEDTRAYRSGRIPVLEVALVLGLTAFAAFQFFVSVHRYHALLAHTMDLGAFEQVLWKISYGDWRGFSTIFQDPAVAQDGCLWLYPLAVGFRYLGGPYFLFAVQSLGTIVSAWGIYRIGLLYRLERWVAATVALTFVLYPAIIGGSQFDFHPDFVALPFVVWGYAAYVENRRWLYYLGFLAAALAKNLVLVSFVGWGIGLIVWRRRWWDGVVAIAAAGSLLWLELGWLFPTYLPGATSHLNLSFYEYLGHGIDGVLIGTVTHFPTLVQHVVSHPDYAIWIFGPVVGLSLLGSAAVPAALSLFMLNAGSDFFRQRELNAEYQVLLAGWMFLALVEALARWPRYSGRLAVIVLAATSLFELLFVPFLIGPALASPTVPFRPIEEAMASVPIRDVLWTQDHLGVFAYRFPVYGVDRQIVPGHMLDGLPTLWAEVSRRPVQSTALVARRPVSPYFADIVAHALLAGYRITFHAGRVFVVAGRPHFMVSPAANVDSGWEPRAAIWTIPAWTQGSVVGVVNWGQRWLVAPQGHAGVLIRPIPVYLRPGIYRLMVGLIMPSTDRHPGEIVGSLWWGQHVVHRTSIKDGSADVTATITIRRGTWVNIGATSNGVRTFAVSTVTLRRLTVAG